MAPLFIDVRSVERTSVSGTCPVFTSNACLKTRLEIYREGDHAGWYRERSLILGWVVEKTPRWVAREIDPSRPFEVYRVNHRAGQRPGETGPCDHLMSRLLYYCAVICVISL